jgi:multiple sugar transport system permease protein
MALDPQGRREARTAWLLMAPFLAILAVFFLYAAFRAAWFSLTDYDLFNQPRFVGIRNYLALFSDPLFGRAFVNSLTFAIFVTTAQTTLALMLAVFVNGITQAKGLVRTVFYFPSIVSSTVMTLIFLWLFQRQGLATGFANGLSNWLPHLMTFVGVLALVQTALVWNARRRYFDVRSARRPSRSTG